MSPEMFNPGAPEYKKVKDLPKEEQSNFSDVEGGFVRKAAKDEFEEAEKIAELANEFKRVGISKGISHRQTAPLSR